MELPGGTQDLDPLPEERRIEDKSLVLASLPRRVHPVPACQGLQLVEGRPVHLPPEPFGAKRCRRDPRDEETETRGDHLLQVLLLVPLPERIEAPEAQVMTDPLDPGGLVHRVDRPCHHPFDPLLPGGEGNGPGEVGDLLLLDPSARHRDEGEARRLGLEASEVDVRGMEQVAFRVRGNDGDHAGDLLLLHRPPCGEGRVLAAREEDPEPHVSRQAGGWPVKSLSPPLDLRPPPLDPRLSALRPAPPLYRRRRERMTPAMTTQYTFTFPERARKAPTPMSTRGRFQGIWEPKRMVTEMRRPAKEATIPPKARLRAGESRILGKYGAMPMTMRKDGRKIPMVATNPPAGPCRR